MCNKMNGEVDFPLDYLLNGTLKIQTLKQNKSYEKIRKSMEYLIIQFSLSSTKYFSKLKSKEQPQTFVPKILVSWYPEWANCKGFLEL